MSARIDAHVHLWNRALDPQDWIDPETMAPIDRDFGTPQLRDMLDSTAIDRAIVVQSSNSLAESVRLVGLDAAVIAGLVAWVDLTGDVLAQLELLHAGASVPVVGVRHLAHIDPDPKWLLRADVGRGLDALGRAGLCFDLVVRDWQLPQAVALASRHEELRFVLDHLGGPSAPGGDCEAWEAGFRGLARLPNVVAKVSGLTSGLVPGAWDAPDLSPVIDIALSAYGPARLLYGSDWPLAELGGGAGAWMNALESLLVEISESERLRIFGGTASEVYSLS